MNSEQTNELAAALAKAQGVMENAKLNKANPYFKSKYADLASVIEAIKKPLADNGLGFTQTIDIGESSLMLTTKLMHASGQWIDSDYPLPLVPDKPQVLGSALTYARRYALAAICGIAAEEDDDANAAQAAGGAKKPPKPAPDVMKAVGEELADHAALQHPPHDPQTGEVKPAETNGFGSAPGINIQDMAREAAQRGREVMKQFYKSRSKAEKAEIDLIRPELDDMVDAAEVAAEGEGS